MAVTLECVLQGRLAGQLTILARHYHSPSAVVMPAVAEFVDQLVTQWESTINVYISIGWSAEQWIIRNVMTGSVGLPYTPEDYPNQGGDDNDFLPSFCSYNFRLNGVASIKPTHGFARIPGVSLTYYASNTVAPADRSAIATAAENYFTFSPTTSGGAGAWLPVIYSKTSLNFNGIHSVSLSNAIGHQVSRHIGHGS